jgi:hypothetical protein
VYHRERAREIVGLLAAPSVLETGNTSSHWLSFLLIQIFLELNYPEKLTHGKDYQWLKYIKVRPQFCLFWTCQFCQLLTELSSARGGTTWQKPSFVFYEPVSFANS